MNQPQQFLYLNPRNIIFPDRYNGNPKEFDIAFIGLEVDHLEILKKYYKSIEGNNKINFFDDKILDPQQERKLVVCGYPGIPTTMKVIGYP